MKAKKLVFGVFIAVASQWSLADDKIITVNRPVSYYDENIISSKIIDECKNLGTQFSASTKLNLEKDGWAVNYSENTDVQKDGIQLKLTIANAMSIGNAFAGHQKSVSVIVGLYKNGALIDTYKGTRDSRGGFGAGFKGSCAVLERCVDTLGKDTAKWLKKKSI
jgi:hypothetical protein